MRSYASLLLGALFLVACGGDDESNGATPDGSAAPDGKSSVPPSFDAGSAVDATAPDDSNAPPVTEDAAPPVKPGEPIDAGPTVTGTITVSPGTKVGTIPPAFLGFSYEKTQLQSGLFSSSDTALIALFKLLGTGLLRIGGNDVDRTQWYTSPVASSAPKGTITKAQVDSLAAFAKASGWKVLYAVDMKLSSPSVAADEAKYVSTTLAGSYAGLEIGNEPDLYPSTAASPTWSYGTFKTQWAAFATAIQGSAGATTPLTGPASAANYGSWTVPFAADDGSKITLLTQHYYRGNGQLASSTVQALLTPDPNLGTELDALDKAAKAANIKGGYRLSECNSYYNGGAPNVSNAFGTALWVIDFLFQNAEHGSAGINLHGGGNGTGYTPIADSNGAVVEARPEFYGVLLFALAGQGDVVATTVKVTNNLNVSAYAVRATDGSTNIVVVSKDKSNGIHASIDVGAAVTSAGVTYLQGPSLDASSGVTLGTATIDPSGAFAPTGPIPLAVSGQIVTVDVPAASAALIHAK